MSPGCSRRPACRPPRTRSDGPSARVRALRWNSRNWGTCTKGSGTIPQSPSSGNSGASCSPLRSGSWWMRSTTWIGSSSDTRTCPSSSVSPCRRPSVSMSASRLYWIRPSCSPVTPSSPRQAYEASLSRTSSRGPARSEASAGSPTSPGGYRASTGRTRSTTLHASCTSRSCPPMIGGVSASTTRLAGWRSGSWTLRSQHRCRSVCSILPVAQALFSTRPSGNMSRRRAASAIRQVAYCRVCSTQ